MKQGEKMECDGASDRVTSSSSCSSSFPRALDGQGREHPKANNKGSNQTRKAIKHRLWNNKQTWQQQQQLKETKGGRESDIKSKASFVYLFNKKKASYWCQKWSLDKTFRGARRVHHMARRRRYKLAVTDLCATWRWGSVTVCFGATPQLGLGLQRDVGEEATRWDMHQITGRLNLLLLANFLDRRLPSSRFFAVCLVGGKKKCPACGG